MKKILIILAIILLAIAGYWAWLKFSPSKYIDGFNLIPDDAVMVIETEKPIESWQTFSSSDMWNDLKTFPAFAEITKNADVLDDMVKNNQTIFNLIGKRHLIISTHMTKAKDYDFVYYTDIKEASKSDIIKTSLVTLIKRFGYSHTVRTYLDNEIHEFMDSKTREVLYLSFAKNYLVLSYNKSLMDKVIVTSQANTGQLASAKRFDEINQLTTANGLCRVFINFNTFHQYMGVYMDDVTDVKELFSSLFYTAFDWQLKDNVLTADGYSLVNDSISSYLQALSYSGKAETNSENIFSEKTSFYLSMGFDNFNGFYQKLNEIWKKDLASYEENTQNIKKVEKLLNINLQKNLFDWIDNEIAIAQYQTDKLIGNKVHSIMAIKANNINNAIDNLNQIEKQIRKRTPLKFKEVVYREHSIKYLEVKGLFKSLFGKLFAKFSKPYYTVLDNYVVMSDDPKTLLLTIDDFENDKVLGKNDDYRSFRSQFSDKISVFTYMSADRHFANFKGLMNPESWNSSQKNQNYIRCFPHIGLSLSGDGDKMRTVISSAYKKYEIEQITEDTSLENESDTLTALDLFLIANFQNNLNCTYYDNGQIKTATEMDGNTIDGAYMEYYENGIIKTKGRYRKGIKDGTWKHYKPDGEFDYKEKYINGELKKAGFFERLFGGEED